MKLLKKAMRSGVLIPLISGLILIAILLLTDPLRLPLALLFVPFILFYICLRGIFKLILDHLYSRATARKLRILSNGLAAIVVFILVLQSLGQLSWRDLLLAGSFIVATVFYFAKTDVV